MEVIFDNKLLEKIETEKASDTKLPFNVIKSARRKLTLLRSAPDERTLRNWKSLHYEKLKGDKKNLKSIRLNDQWRIIFQLVKEGNFPKIIVLSIEDYHRKGKN